MLTEAAITKGNWQRTVGICDAPSQMKIEAAKILQAKQEEVFLDYFGLNHLGWTKAIYVNGKDVLPEILAEFDKLPIKELLPFSTELIKSLKMIPNEYLYYFYSSKTAVQNILSAERTRGEEILAANKKFFAEIDQVNDDPNKLVAIYTHYLELRRIHYMETETGKSSINPLEPITLDLQGGYAEVALRLIKSLESGERQIHIVNTLNKGAIKGLPEDCVVEVPCIVGKDFIQPCAVGEIPLQCLGLLARVKAYEQLTIEAAFEGSTRKAVDALIVHPLVADEKIAKTIIDKFKIEFGESFLAGVK
jgi:6-phospho-beta-glucosidase